MTDMYILHFTLPKTYAFPLLHFQSHLFCIISSVIIGTVAVPWGRVGRLKLSSARANSSTGLFTDLWFWNCLFNLMPAGCVEKIMRVLRLLSLASSMFHFRWGNKFDWILCSPVRS